MTVANVARLVFTGKLPGGEIFSTGMSGIYSTPPSSQAAFQDDCDSMRSAGTDYTSFVSGLCALNRPSFSITDFTGYFYASFPGPATYQSHAPVPGAPGTASSAAMPDQCCLVCTLLTGAPGRRNRGRMYLPLGAATLDTNAELDTSVPIGGATAVAHLARALNASPLGLVASVVSSVGSTSRPITDIGSDTRVDIQRRRANHQGPNVKELVPV